MIQSYLNKTREQLPLLLAGIAVSILLLEVLWIPIVAILLVLLLLRYEKKFVIVFSFVSLITLTSSLSPTLRLTVQLSNFLLLTYFFIKNYQFDFKSYPKIPKPVVLLFILLFSSMLLSIVFSEYPATGIEQLVRTGIFFLFIYLFYSLIESDDDLRLFMVAFFVATAVLFIVVLSLFYSANFNLLRFQQKLLFGGEQNYIHKNGIGSFFVIAISILTAFYFSKLRTSHKVKIAITIFFLFLGLIITNSRAAIVSLIISTTFILYVFNKKAMFRLFIGLVLLFPVILFEPISSFMELYFRVDQVFTGRDMIVEAMNVIISNNFIFGTGPAAVQFELYKEMPFLIGSYEWLFLSRHIESISYGHAHSFYLFFLSELGILGLMTAIIFPIIFFSIGYRTVNRIKTNSKFQYALVIGIIATGISLFFRGIFEWGGLISYGAIASDLPFWWWFICLIYLSNKYAKSDLKLPAVSMPNYIPIN
jgi:O-antigen ligase